MGVAGVASAIVAKSNGRSTVVWFLAGFFTFGIALVRLFVLPNLNEQEAVRKRLEEEGRRTQEGADKERALARARHPETLGRLGDAGHTAEDSERAAQSLVDNAATDTDLPYQDSDWFHDSEDEFVGPMPFESLHLTWLAESIDGETLVWRRGMHVWVAIADLDGMSSALDG